MKKALIFIALVVVIVFSLNNKTNEYVIVPNESIRFRIIPNSNSIEDIFMKEKVKESISNVINEIETSENIDETRKNIISSIPKVESSIDTLFIENNYDKTYKVKYGMNYFPEKIYKGVKYPEGNYESMVVEIGNASGDNYWCVLFPPLCMIEAEESEDIEYKFFISEIINKFLKRN